MPVARIESLDREGRGVAHHEGKTVFVDGAVPDEIVEYASYRKKPAWEAAQILRIEREGGARVSPRCAFFGQCGGCSMQHVEERAQVAAKQRVLEDALWHIGRVRPETMLRPVYGMPWGYRHRARMSVRWVPKKGGSLVGFRERRSSYVTDMTSCEVLPRSISDLIPALRALVSRLAARSRLPQIEVAVGDESAALVFRHLDELGEDDQAMLREFAQASGVRVWLQSGGPESARPLEPAQGEPLWYALPEFGVRIRFLPTDFTQVNQGVNRVLVSRALRLLDPRPGERIAELFCGLGNFSLPIARSGAQVVGFEGNAGLVERARENAAANALAARFEVADLTKGEFIAHGPFDKLLLDPPREGAIEAVKALPQDGPRRIVYVSCDPATLARDAAILVNVKGMRLAAAGVVNMFPHTAHVESIALFEKNG